RFGNPQIESGSGEPGAADRRGGGQHARGFHRGRESAGTGRCRRAIVPSPANPGGTGDIDAPRTTGTEPALRAGRWPEPNAGRCRSSSWGDAGADSPDRGEGVAQIAPTEPREDPAGLSGRVISGDDRRRLPASPEYGERALTAH